MSTVCITFTYIHNHSHVSLCLGAQGTQGALCSRCLQSWIDQFVARFVPHWRIRLRPALGFASDPSCAGRLLCFAGEDPSYSVKANIESRGAGSFGRQGRSSVSGLMLWKSTRMESQHNPITGQDIRPFEDINVFLSILSGQMCKYIKRIQKISEDWNTY